MRERPERIILTRGGLKVARHWLQAGDCSAASFYLRQLLESTDISVGELESAFALADRCFDPRHLATMLRPFFNLHWNHPGMQACAAQIESCAANMEFARVACQRWDSCQPANPYPRAEWLRLSLFDDLFTGGQYIVNARAWGSRFFAARSVVKPRSLRPPWRVGYVSQSFTSLPRASLIRPILELHNPDYFKIYCYVTGHPICQAEFPKVEWRDAASLNPSQLVQAMGDDHIDIAVNVDGLMDVTSLAAFAIGCAPEQLALPNYFASTGLDCFDSRLSHPAIESPAEWQSQYSEPLFSCSVPPYTYSPPAFMPPLRDAPFYRNGYLTVGFFNSALKWTPPCFELLSSLLEACHNVRLLLHCPGLDGQLAQDFLQKTCPQPALRSRVRTVGSLSHWDHLDLHNHVDLMIDSYPLGGATTTLEALWMGRSVLTLAGPGLRSGFTAYALH